MNRVGGRLHVFSASAHVPALRHAAGRRRLDGGAACLIPRASLHLYELCRAGAWDAAMRAQRPLWRMNELFARHNLAACVKAGLILQGFDVGAPVPPQSPLGPRWGGRAGAGACGDGAGLTRHQRCPNPPRKPPK